MVRSNSNIVYVVFVWAFSLVVREERNPNCLVSLSSWSESWSSFLSGSSSTLVNAQGRTRNFANGAGLHFTATLKAAHEMTTRCKDTIHGLIKTNVTGILIVVLLLPKGIFFLFHTTAVIAAGGITRQASRQCHVLGTGWMVLVGGG